MTHKLEHNIIERARWNVLTDTKARAARRRAVEAMSDGALPTWAQRKAQGLKASFDVAGAVSMYRAGATLQAVADNYGVTAQAVGYHVRKAKASA